VAEEPKEPVNFRLGKTYRQALEQLARERDTTLGQLVREVVEEYIDGRARFEWELEARRTAAELGRAARDSDWVWEEGER
jgi:predicted DNA-binding protein